MQEWMECLQNAIGRALNSDHSTEHELKGGGQKEKLEMEFLEAESQVVQSKQLARAEYSQAIEDMKSRNLCCADCGSDSTSTTVFHC